MADEQPLSAPPLLAVRDAASEAASDLRSTSGVRSRLSRCSSSSSLVETWFRNKCSEEQMKAQQMDEFTNERTDTGKWTHERDRLMKNSILMDEFITIRGYSLRL